MVGIGLMHFPTCPQEALLLQQVFRFLNFLNFVTRQGSYVDKSIFDSQWVPFLSVFVSLPSGCFNGASVYIFVRIILRLLFRNITGSVLHAKCLSDCLKGKFLKGASSVTYIYIFLISNEERH